MIYISATGQSNQRNKHSKYSNPLSKALPTLKITLTLTSALSAAHKHKETHSQTLLEDLLAVMLVPIVPAKLTSGPRMRVLDTN